MAADLEFQAWPPPCRALAALAVEALVGYPAGLHRRLPHPVVWIGALVDRLEHAFNRPVRSEAARRALGVLSLGLVAGGAAAVGVLVQRLLAGLAWGILPFALVASVGLAQRSLYVHVLDVARALAAGDLQAGREAVGRIVGRDTAEMDASEVSAAAVESLAESFNDGVVAPALWLAIAGLPGLFVFKAVSTADSMIGHMEPRWRAFGWASARADDLMNLVPARIAGALVVLAGGSGLRTMLRDARRHASPNAGWPEAAMAGALGVRLGGSVRYDGVACERPVFGEGEPPGPVDLHRGLGVYLVACGLLWTLVGLGALAWPR